ncbi:amino acid permease [Sandarakinorhabdus oryzae]|uniref:amino acid permease n=1 Tax=Sandarakinorhabdus oryzae TaxID=2675220 RepID=UPI0012E2E1C0|nr:amino acid permease [Sandarakinorhabdus oryzae]
MTDIRRELGLAAALALVVGNMVGSGVFLLPATLAPYGWSAMGGWVIALVGTLALAGCYAMLSRQMPGQCGPHAYVETAFGAEVSYVAAWSYWIGVWVGNAALAVAVVSNLTVILPGLATDPVLSAFAAAAVLVLVTVINLAGAPAASFVQQATTILKLIPLVAVLAIAAWLLGTKGSAAVVNPPGPLPSLGMHADGVITSVTLTMWAFLAFESATVPADKIRRPEFTVPLATVLGPLLAGVLYMAISAAMIALVPAKALASSNAPFADFAAPFIGNGAATLIGLFAAISALGTVNGLTLTVAELPRALALAGQFPPRYARLNKAGAPAPGLILSGALAAVLVLMNTDRNLAGLFEFTILVATSAMLIGYLAVAMAAVKLLGGVLRLVGIAGILYSIFALYAAGLEPNLWCLGLVAVGAPVYLYSRKRA